VHADQPPVERARGVNSAATQFAVESSRLSSCSVLSDARLLDEQVHGLEGEHLAIGRLE